jgi:hypothetical protein
MLDDVERRALLVQPAREDPLPAAPRLLDVELDEGAGQFLIFPRRRRIAGAQADDRVAEADRLPRLHRDVADDAVALVEQPEHRHALGHRGHPGNRLDGPWRVDRHRAGAIGRLVRLARATIAARKREQQRQRCKAGGQDYSGFHA